MGKVGAIERKTQDRLIRLLLIELKKHRAIWEDFWDGLVSESRRKEKGISYEQYRTRRLKRKRSRG